MVSSYQGSPGRQSRRRTLLILDLSSPDPPSPFHISKLRFTSCDNTLWLHEAWPPCCHDNDVCWVTSLTLSATLGIEGAFSPWPEQNQSPNIHAELPGSPFTVLCRRERQTKWMAVDIHTLSHELLLFLLPLPELLSLFRCAWRCHKAPAPPLTLLLRGEWTPPWCNC